MRDNDAEDFRADYGIDEFDDWITSEDKPLLKEFDPDTDYCNEHSCWKPYCLSDKHGG